MRMDRHAQTKKKKQKNYVFSILRPTHGKLLSTDFTGTMKTAVRRRVIKPERNLLKDTGLVAVLIL